MIAGPDQTEDVGARARGRALSLGAFPLSLPLAQAIAIPSRVRIRSKSTSNSANVARMSKNILPIGSAGSQTVPPIDSRTP